MVLGVCWPCIGVCRTHADTCSHVGERPKCRRRVADLTEPISVTIDRSASEEANRGTGFSNRSLEAPNLGFKRCGGVGRVNHES